MAEKKILLDRKSLLMLITSINQERDANGSAGFYYLDEEGIKYDWKGATRVIVPKYKGQLPFTELQLEMIRQALWRWKHDNDGLTDEEVKATEQARSRAIYILIEEFSKAYIKPLLCEMGVDKDDLYKRSEKCTELKIKITFEDFPAFDRVRVERIKE